MKDVSVSGYDGYATVTNGLVAYAAADGSIPTTIPSSYTVSNLTGFYKWCVAPIVRMGANTVFNYKGDGTGPARALIKMIFILKLLQYFQNLLMQMLQETLLVKKHILQILEMVQQVQEL